MNFQKCVFAFDANSREVLSVAVPETSTPPRLMLTLDVVRQRLKGEQVYIDTIEGEAEGMIMCRHYAANNLTLFIASKQQIDSRIGSGLLHLLYHTMILNIGQETDFCVSKHALQVQLKEALNRCKAVIQSILTTQRVMSLLTIAPQHKLLEKDTLQKISPVLKKISERCGSEVTYLLKGHEVLDKHGGWGEKGLDAEALHWAIPLMASAQCAATMRETRILLSDRRMRMVSLLLIKDVMLVLLIDESRTDGLSAIAAAAVDLCKFLMADWMGGVPSPPLPSSVSSITLVTLPCAEYLANHRDDCSDMWWVHTRYTQVTQTHPSRPPVISTTTHPPCTTLLSALTALALPIPASTNMPSFITSSYQTPKTGPPTAWRIYSATPAATKVILIALRSAARDMEPIWEEVMEHLMSKQRKKLLKETGFLEK